MTLSVAVMESPLIFYVCLGYLTLMKQLHETQRDRSSMASMIAKAVTEQGQFNAAQGDHTNALKGLNTASTSLKMVKTIFLESAKFWKRQKQFIIDYLRAVSVISLPDLYSQSFL